jgi:hypothetical protein
MFGCQDLSGSITEWIIMYTLRMYIGDVYTPSTEADIHVYLLEGFLKYSTV